MPNVVGLKLSDAEVTVAAVGGSLGAGGVWDAFGDRQVKGPSGWYVCEQTPTAGTALPSGSAVALTVVKRLESCP